MAFCPNCGFEYEPDISKCPDCGDRLVNKPPQESDRAKQQEPIPKGEFVLLRNVPSRLYAQMLQEALKNQGIVSMIKGDEGYPLRTTTTHIPISKITVWVSTQDLAKAQVIADQMLDHI